MHTLSSRPRRRSERGAAAVEFALVLPLLLLMLGGIVDFGRALYTQNVLTNAAREGARATLGTTPSTADVQARADAAGVTGMNTAVTLCAGPGTDATVTTSVDDFEWYVLGPALSVIGADTVLGDTLESKAVVRCP